MKTVHIQKVAGVGGSERHLMVLLPGLIAMGHDVQMVVLDAPGSERFVEPVRGMGVSVDVMPAAREGILGRPLDSCKLCVGSVRMSFTPISCTPISMA